MKKGILILTSVVVVGGAAYWFYTNQAKKLEDMTYKLIGVSFDNLSLTQNTVVNLKFMISSDSTLEALVMNLNLKVLLDGREIGIIQENKPFVIPAKGYSIVDLKVTTNLLNTGVTLMDLAGEIAKNRDAIITLSGNAKIKAAFLTFPVPVNYSDSIKNYV